MSQLYLCVGLPQHLHRGTSFSHGGDRLTNLQLQLKQFQCRVHSDSKGFYSICLIKVEFKAGTDLGIPDFSVFCLSAN